MEESPCLITDDLVALIETIIVILNQIDDVLSFLILVEPVL